MQYYYIMNGKQMGPVEAQRLPMMGVTRETLVWRKGLPQWVSAGALPELGYLFGSAPGVPPSVAGQAWPGAVAGLVLGICSICFSAPVLGLLLGCAGLWVTKDSYNEYRVNPYKYTSGGLLNAAHIVSLIGVIFGGITTVWLLFAMAVYGVTMFGLLFN